MYSGMTTDTKALVSQCDACLRERIITSQIAEPYIIQVNELGSPVEHAPCYVPAQL